MKLASKIARESMRTRFFVRVRDLEHRGDSLPLQAAYFLFWFLLSVLIGRFFCRQSSLATYVAIPRSFKMTIS